MKDKILFVLQRVTSSMGIVIGDYDFNGKTSPVSPMPTPDYNVLVAIQTSAAGTATPTAVSTIARSARLVMNDVTATMPEFASLMTAAFQAYSSADANTNMIGYSRLTDLLIRIGINQVFKWRSRIRSRPGTIQSYSSC